MLIKALTLAAVSLSLTSTDPHQNFCSLVEPDVDTYLFDLYLKTPKIDKTGNFVWKDPAAAARAGMSLKTYVIGGADSDAKLRLYELLKTLEALDYQPGITSAYRDDYRQGIAAGRNKSAPGRSFHGGGRVGGFGHGIAFDIVSLGKDRAEQLAKSPRLWAAIDRYGKLFGLGRPYGDRDAPHVAPLYSKEFVVGARKIAAKVRTAHHRLRAKARRVHVAHR